MTEKSVWKTQPEDVAKTFNLPVLNLSGLTVAHEGKVKANL